MPYSAVTQPLPVLRRNGGTRSSTEAVHSTCVSPNLARQEPSAYFATPGSRVTKRMTSASRPEGRTISSVGSGPKLVLVSDHVHTSSQFVTPGPHPPSPAGGGGLGRGLLAPKERDGVAHGAAGSGGEGSTRPPQPAGRAAPQAIAPGVTVDAIAAIAAVRLLGIQLDESAAPSLWVSSQVALLSATSGGVWITKRCSMPSDRVACNA